MGSIVGGIKNAFGFQEASSGQLQGAANQTQDEAFRQIQLLKQQEENQKNFGNQLYNQASGKAPSFAEAQMRTAQDRSLAQQIAAARSNRGVNPGLASRNLGMNAANMAMNTNQAAAQARLQEQLANQAQYSGYLGQQQAYVNGLSGQATQGQQAAFNASSANAAAGNKWAGDIMGMIAGGAAMAGSMTGAPDPKAMQGGGAGQGYSGNTGRLGADTNLGTPMYNQGGMVKGKAKVEGDSPANDIINARVSPGEVIIKRSVVEQGPEAVATEGKKIVKQNKSFLEAAMDKSAQSGSMEDESYGALLAKMSELNKRISGLEKKGSK